MCGNSTVYLLRQLLVLFSICTYSFCCGIELAFPSILNPALISPNSTDIKASPDQASWIAACHGLSGFLGYAIFSPTFQAFGRKIVIVILNSVLLVGWIIFYFSNSITSLVCARLCQGLTLGGIMIIAVTLSENCHPSRRGYFMSLKKVSLACGSLTCHSLGLVWTWRHIAAFGVLVSCASVSIALLCPESAHYLAMKGRFEECKKSFRWLFGQSHEAEKELKELIAAQVVNIEEKKMRKKSYMIVETAKVFLKKDFQRPLLIVILATLAVDASGRYYFIAYKIQIMMAIFGDKTASIYYSIIGDCLLIAALAFSCVTVKRFTRRTLCFKFGFFSAFLMFLVSATGIFQSYRIIPNVRWLTPCTILLHSFIAHVGIIPVTLAIMCEIFPLQYKGIGSFTVGMIFTLFYTITFKLTPLMIEKIGIEGTYAVYGLCVLICLGFLFFILPETKDRTLQDIEDEIRGTKRNTAEVQSVLLKNTEDRYALSGY